MMEIKLTEGQQCVIRAIYEVRTEKRTKDIEHSWIEDKTVVLRIQGNVKKTNKIGRQNWTEPFKNTPADKIWKLIGEAARNRLPYNHPIEAKIRACNNADTALVAELKEQITQLLARTDKAEAAKAKAIAELDEFKSNYYNEQCTDALFRINLNKTINLNTNLLDAAKHDSATIKRLTCEVQTLTCQLASLEAKLADETPIFPTGVEAINPPKFFEPRISGKDERLEEQELLAMYEKAIESRLGEVDLYAKDLDADVTIVFHEFRVDIKAFFKEGKIPLRSTRRDNIIFACNGLSPDIRRKIYHRLSVVSSYTPRIVDIFGKGKVEYLPNTDRSGENNHDRFIFLVRAGAFRTLPLNGRIEGYDIVAYRNLDNEK